MEIGKLKIFELKNGLYPLYSNMVKISFGQYEVYDDEWKKGIKIILEYFAKNHAKEFEEYLKTNNVDKYVDTYSNLINKRERLVKARQKGNNPTQILDTKYYLEHRNNTHTTFKAIISSPKTSIFKHFKCYDDVEIYYTFDDIATMKKSNINAVSITKYNEIEKEERMIIEGQREERTYLHIKRDISLVKECKDSDNYECQACAFRYENRIVEAHHLEPISEKGEGEITLSGLITLCPTCHRVAHYLLNKDKSLTTKESLVPEIKNILEKAYNKT